MNKRLVFLLFFIFSSIVLSTNAFSQQNVNKLIALLINPMSAGSFGQFTQGERVVTTRALLRVIDLQISNNVFFYLVAVNDLNVTKPFYIITNRRLELMNLQFPNTIFEDLDLEYIYDENYISNGVQRDTFVFRLSTMN